MFYLSLHFCEVKLTVVLFTNLDLFLKFIVIKKVSNFVKYLSQLKIFKLNNQFIHLAKKFEFWFCAKYYIRNKRFNLVLIDKQFLR